MILQVPKSAVKFAANFFSGTAKLAPPHIRRALAPMIAAVALSASARVSLASLGNQIFSKKRHKATMSRRVRDKRFKTRELLWTAAKRLMRAAAPKSGKVAVWLLTLDGTAIQHGADTLIKGAIESRKKESTKRTKRKKGARGQRQRSDTSSKKGRRTKYHMFLIASLTTHTGVRIPLGRYTCDPTTFNRAGRPRRVRTTQIDLAKVLIERALSMLPKGVELRVVADSYFEGEKLFGLAHRRGFTLITPTDSNRCFADEASPHKSNGICIRDYGIGLDEESFSRLDLVRGSEKTACYRRYSARKAGPKDRRTYWLHHERRTVAKLGAVGVVYSWKTPVFEPKRNFKKKSFKILLCSDPSLTGPEIVEWYECRWTAIEILIRELKGQLGLDHYAGQSLEALERHIDLVLLGFLYLEAERHRLIEAEETPPHIREHARTARTHGMQDILRWEANQMLLDTVLRSYKSERAERRVKRFLKQVHSTLDTSPQRRAA